MTEGAGTVKDDVEHDGRPHHVIEVADPTYPVELIVDAEGGQVSMLRTMQNDYIWGDVEIEVSYGDWSSPEGSSLQFPHRVELALSGNTLHAESRTDVVVNPEFAADAFALPRGAAHPGRPRGGPARSTDGPIPHALPRHRAT